jgi:hypothetical protein
VTFHDTLPSRGPTQPTIGLTVISGYGASRSLPGKTVAGRQGRSAVRSTFRAVHLITQSVCVGLVKRVSYSLRGYAQYREVSVLRRQLR